MADQDYEDCENLEEKATDLLAKLLDKEKSILRMLFPYGHPKFIELTLKELELHSRKNHDYSLGGDPLGNFKRVASILQNYPNLKLTSTTVTIIFLLKQLDSALWMLSQGYEGQVEGHTERWQDISVYSKIISILIGELQNK